MNGLVQSLEFRVRTVTLHVSLLSNVVEAQDYG